MNHAAEKPRPQEEAIAEHAGVEHADAEYEAVERGEHGRPCGAVAPALYEAPGDATGLSVEGADYAGHPCVLARPAGCDPQPGLLVVLDGQRIVKRIGKFVESGQVVPASLPILVGVDSDDWLADYTPWWQPAYRKEAPDFGGRAPEFIEGTLVPLVLDARRRLGCEGPVRVLGYSLATLAMVQALTLADVFDELLIASPSSWYPGFVNMVERTPLVCRPSTRVVLASGADEGVGEPEPIRGIRRDTDRLVATLSERLAAPVEVAFDEKDHHGGFALRLRWLLAHM